MSASIDLTAVLRALQAEAALTPERVARFDSWAKLRAAQERGPGHGRDHPRACEFSLFDPDCTPYRERNDR